MRQPGHHAPLCERSTSDRRPRTLRHCLALTYLTVPLLLAGCWSGSQNGSDALSQQYQQRLLVAEQPTDIRAIRDAYQAFQPDQSVTIAGRIYADGMSPFDPQQAVFTIIELPKPGHNHEDPGDCPFCRRELKNAKFSVVQVTDEAGMIVPRSADKLLGLSKNQNVVVFGKASLVGETLIVHLSGLHKLTSSAAEALSAQFHQTNE
ncbi:MAG: hypothetical protein KF752_03715 [Pirellulaceae bacterium]|nr:hypothetical protein [Pirellulaceae bacterium]